MNEERSERMAAQPEPAVPVDTRGVNPQGQPNVAPDRTPDTAAEPTTSEVADGYSGRQKVELFMTYGTVTNEYGTFVAGEPQSVNKEAQQALLELRGPHGEQIFREV